MLTLTFSQRNLVDSGGWIDEVHWVQNTVDQDDLRYLDEILASSPRYKKVDLTTEGIGFEGYAHAWDHLERGKLYVKIDDDVVSIYRWNMAWVSLQTDDLQVWFADDAIPRIVTLKVAHTETLIVSANIINSPLMGWVHYHVGALHPYFPEFGVFERTTSPLDLTSSKKKPWRYTEYPFWEGPDDWFFDLEQDPPYDGHRWLRLKNDTDIKRTPANEIEYNTWGTGLKSWAIAAQEHYSFLENLAEDALDRYKLGRMWITDYDRLSINFMTFWADEVLDHLPMDTVDEDWLTRVLPQRIQKSVAVDSNALAAHFTFGTQHGVETTDLLARYHDYALENACRRRF